MHILFVHCHPSDAGFCAAIRDRGMAAARAAGHEVTLIDLYAEHFDPVMHATEWRGYNDAASLPPDLVRHLSILARIDAMIFVYPTWWDGPPAMLKGWLDRLWRPNFAFHPDALELLPGMNNIRTVGVITTYGGPDTGSLFNRMPPMQKRFLDTLKPCVNRRASFFGLGLFEAHEASPEALEAFLLRVETTIGRLG